MKSKNTIVLLIIIFIIIFVIFNIFLLTELVFNKEKLEKLQEIYDPQINPKDFVSGINNKYLIFIPGTTFVYEGKTEDGIERTEVYTTNNKKNIMGINTISVWDRVWLDDELIEDTKDYFAQDKYGNVWYFGEDSKELVNGKIASTKGSWQAGVNGAQPGIVMKANPQAGDIYRQEYYKGEAEDMAEVVSLGVKIKIAYGSFSDCIQTRDWNPLEPSSDEYKYYCPEIAGLVYEVGVKDGKGTQLINVVTGPSQTEQDIGDEPKALKAGITEQEAIAIAKSAVEGIVIDVGIEKKYGKASYVVEIDADGTETDVILDVETGNVLGIET